MLTAGVTSSMGHCQGPSSVDPWALGQLLLRVRLGGFSLEGLPRSPPLHLRGPLTVLT